jgi:hypothetical protein
MIELPPLPDEMERSLGDIPRYSDAMMRAYGEACARAALEAAAQLWTGGVDIYHDDGFVIRGHSGAAAEAIRALATAPSSPSSSQTRS